MNKDGLLLKPLSLFKRIQEHITIVIILTVGLALRAYMAWVDPFLHPWDERFHALVARNMMHHPFKPMLRAFPVTDNYDPNLWCCNHIWLHKQPLFMWQMALSMKVFGVSTFTMRLPSIIMGTLMVLFLYRIVLLLTQKKEIALIAAGLLALSNYHLQMISGIQGMDHNDVAFGFYVLASIWAYSEYVRRPKWYWIVLVGLFAGCAILNKWLLGLLVFLGWGLNILFRLKNKGILKEIKHFLAALIICCIVFIPWQLYILHQFPNEANYEFAYNRRHISEAVEGHKGTALFYIENLPLLFGNYIFLFILPGGILVFFKKHIHRALSFAFWAAIIGVFSFFSFIVKTKIQGYFFFVAPLCMAFAAISIYYFCKAIKKVYLIVPCLFLIFFLTLNPVQIINYLSPNNTERNNRIYNAGIYKILEKEIPSNTKVVMNMNSFEDIDVMFFNNKLTAYHWTLSKNDVRFMKQQKMPLAVFQIHGNYNLPAHIQQYPYLFIINKPLMDF